VYEIRGAVAQMGIYGTPRLAGNADNSFVKNYLIRAIVQYWGLNSLKWRLSTV